MSDKNKFTEANFATGYSFFSNEYTLTEEICAESEISRIDCGIAIAVMTITLMILLMVPFIPDMIHEYFLYPSDGTILQLSGIVGVTFLSPAVVFLCLIKIFPRLVGAKRFKEQLELVPSIHRQVAFYDTYVEVIGKFSRKLYYKELKRTGETRNLYLLFFTKKRMLIVHKSGFRKGTLRGVKSFIKERRTWKSRVYGIIRYLPAVGYFLLYTYALWTEM